jgi:hypothetical protein
MKHHIRLISTTTSMWIDQIHRIIKYDQIDHNSNINIH